MKSLKIQNLILIEKAEIQFDPTLNIITGETGSGKSALLSAIRLIAGERADSSIIRKGADFAIVEAVLEGPVFIRREIYRSGKNRCFIDDAQVSLNDLKKAINIEMVDQSSSHKFFSEQTAMLDTFAQLSSEVKQYEESLSLEKGLSKDLELLTKIAKERELEWAQKDLELIEEVGFVPGLEEKLTEEHHLLTHASELSDKVGQVCHLLTEDTPLFQLKKGLNALESCLRFDPNLSEPLSLFKSALLELSEVGHILARYSSKLESNPARLEKVEALMASISTLKRRFGSDIELEKKKLTTKIDELMNLDAKIEEILVAHSQLKLKNEKISKQITSQRQLKAPEFASLVQDELRNLNIPEAKFEIHVSNCYGQIEFLFSANPGVSPTSLELCASGGELSRLLLAIKTILSDGNSTLVFDEIDSNVGGQTATILGGKLKELAKKRQVISVTHFVQVAKCAQAHFLVSKKAVNENSFTLVTKLGEKEKEIEYDRMMGNTR